VRKPRIIGRQEAPAARPNIPKNTFPVVAADPIQFIIIHEFIFDMLTVISIT